MPVANTILVPGFLKWDGSKFITDPNAGTVGPPGPSGPQGPAGTNTPIASLRVSLALTMDSVVYTVPSTPVNTETFVLSSAILKLTDALTIPIENMSSHAAVSLVTSNSDTVISSFSITSATAVGIVATNDFQVAVPAGTQFIISIVDTGVVFSGTLDVHLYGYFIPNP